SRIVFDGSITTIQDVSLRSTRQTACDTIVPKCLVNKYLASSMTIFYDPRCLEYSSPGHPERPERIARTAPVLKDRHSHWEWRTPTAATDVQLLHAHSPKHVELVANALEHFDADTPLYPNIEVHARRSAGAAIEVTRSSLRRKSGFRLIRTA